MVNLGPLSPPLPYAASPEPRLLLLVAQILGETPQTKHDSSYCCLNSRGHPALLSQHGTLWPVPAPVASGVAARLNKSGVTQ